jgi:hypothetical protein
MGDGRLFQRIEKPDAERGVEWVLENVPGHEYTIGHLGHRATEATVAGLRRRDRRVYRYLRYFDIPEHFYSDFWSELRSIVERRDLWLRTKAGDGVRFGAFGDGPMINPCLVTPEVAHELTAFAREVLPPVVPIWDDMVFDAFEDWFAPARTQPSGRRVLDVHLRDYDPESWARGQRNILSELLPGRLLLVNGPYRVLHALGLEHSNSVVQMFENADEPRHGRITRTWGWWREDRRNVLSLRRTLRSPKVWASIVYAWRHGLVLDLKHRPASRYAWRYLTWRQPRWNEWRKELGSARV